MGFFPTRDMDVSLPDLTEHFSADTLFARRRSGHDSFGRGEDVDTQPTQNPRDFFRSDIYPAARTRDALDARNHWQISGRVFQIDADEFLRAFFRQLVVEDVTLLLQDAG